MPQMPETPGNPRSGGPHHYSRRSDLFLVRLWTTETGEDDKAAIATTADPRSANSETGISKDGENREWWGMVQRTVSGESHEFTSMRGLIELLQAMFPKTERR